MPCAGTSTERAVRLPQRFYRLPIRFDVARLRAETDALPPSAWVAHPNGNAGNDAVRLISVGGGDNEELDGVMRMTPHLERSPYLRQVLASFGVVWSRSRLLRLAPGAVVAMHADINYHWFYRVRMHVPITTRPAVQFTCDGERVHMAAGEAWVFDNWRLHRVDNPSTEERVHLVADTCGSSSFWEMVAGGEQAGVPIRQIEFDPQRSDTPLMERAPPRPVMPPAELDLLILDMRSELVLESAAPAEQGKLARYHALLLGFGQDWRRLYSLYGEDPEGRAELEKLRDAVRERSLALAVGIALKTNRVAAHKVLEARILRACLGAAPYPAAG